MEDWRADEMRRRDQAEYHVGKVVPGSGRLGTPRKMDTMMSVRIPGEVMGFLNNACKLRDMTLTEYMLHAAERLAREEHVIRSADIQTKD